MTQYFAKVKDENGKQILEIGEYSLKQLYRTLEEVDKTGRIDLEKNAVEVYTVEF